MLFLQYFPELPMRQLEWSHSVLVMCCLKAWSKNWSQVKSSWYLQGTLSEVNYFLWVFMPGSLRWWWKEPFFLQAGPEMPQIYGFVRKHGMTYHSKQNLKKLLDDTNKYLLTDFACLGWFVTQPNLHEKHLLVLMYPQSASRWSFNTELNIQ